VSLLLSDSPLVVGQQRPGRASRRDRAITLRPLAGMTLAHRNASRLVGADESCYGD